MGFSINKSLKVLILTKFYKQVYRSYKNRVTINSKKSKIFILRTEKKYKEGGGKCRIQQM